MVFGLAILLVVLISIAILLFLTKREKQDESSLAEKRLADGYKQEDLLKELIQRGIPEDVAIQVPILLHNGGYWIENFPFLANDKVYRRSEEQDIYLDVSQLAKTCNRKEPSKDMNYSKIKTVFDLAFFVSNLPKE